MTSSGTECANNTLTESAQSVAGACRYWSGKNSWPGTDINIPRMPTHPPEAPSSRLSQPQLPPPKAPTSEPWWSATTAAPNDHESKLHQPTAERNSTKNESFDPGRTYIETATRSDTTGRRVDALLGRSRVMRTESPACSLTTTSWLRVLTTLPSRSGMSRRENAFARYVDIPRRLGLCSSTMAS